MDRFDQPDQIGNRSPLVKEAAHGQLNLEGVA
jgi:hypothetical protein